MTEREQILERIVKEMYLVDDDLRLPNSLWNALADAALRAIETPGTNLPTIKPCDCGHNGYGKHHPNCSILV